MLQAVQAREVLEQAAQFVIAVAQAAHVVALVSVKPALQVVQVFELLRQVAQLGIAVEHVWQVLEDTRLYPAVQIEQTVAELHSAQFNTAVEQDEQVVGEDK